MHTSLQTIEWNDVNPWLLPLPSLYPPSKQTSNYDLFLSMVFSLLNVQLYPSHYPPMTSLLLPFLEEKGGTMKKSFTEVIPALIAMRSHEGKSMKIVNKEEMIRQAGDQWIHFPSLVS